MHEKSAKNCTTAGTDNSVTVLIRSCHQGHSCTGFCRSSVTSVHKRKPALLASIGASTELLAASVGSGVPWRRRAEASRQLGLPFPDAPFRGFVRLLRLVLSFRWICIYKGKWVFVQSKCCSKLNNMYYYSEITPKVSWHMEMLWKMISERTSYNIPKRDFTLGLFAFSFFFSSAVQVATERLTSLR
jgi:hypothetical protein